MSYSIAIFSLSSLLEATHNGPVSQSVSAHHEMGDNKAPGGPTSLTSGVSSGVGSTFHGYEDPPGLHEKVSRTFVVPIVMNGNN